MQGLSSGVADGRILTVCSLRGQREGEIPAIFLL